MGISQPRSHEILVFVSEKPNNAVMYPIVLIVLGHRAGVCGVHVCPKKKKKKQTKKKKKKKKKQI